MNILFFVIFPISVILISIVLQKLLKSPILVAILVFAVFLIVAYTAYTSAFLLNAFIYGIIAFLTATIVRLICCLIKNLDFETNPSICENSSNDALQASIESLEDNINTLNDLLTTAINGGNSSCGCNRRR